MDIDQLVIDLWHPLGALAEMRPGATATTKLLGQALEYGVCDTSDAEPWVATVGPDARDLATQSKFGYLWTTLGKNPVDIFDIPEADEDDRRIMNGGSIRVATSAPRGIENFLDMGHFPYVHGGFLGEEPHTEVRDYTAEVEFGNVEHSGKMHLTGEIGEVWARGCEFYQPRAAASASGGQMSQYTYRVPHPYCTMLYKSVPTDPSRRDVIAIFLQPLDEEHIVAHNFLCLVDETATVAEIRSFQQIIFSQDKPILENQYPKRLPLDPRSETPIRADQTSVVYRRWLDEIGLTYAVIPKLESVTS